MTYRCSVPVEFGTPDWDESNEMAGQVLGVLLLCVAVLFVQVSQACQYVLS